MLIQVLRSKLKKVKVTGASTEYEGSITLDPLLMAAAGLHPYERVEVNSVDGKARIVTYVIKGWEPGQVELNGGAANFFKEGDWVHVNCFAIVDNEDTQTHCSYDPPPYNRPGRKLLPIVVQTDENNKIIAVD